MVQILDIFSGAGGLSLGWLAASPDTVRLHAAVDSDESLHPVYEHNFSDTSFVQHTFGSALERDESLSIAKKLGIGPGDIDVLLAGPPCQTFSAAGRRRVLDQSYHVFHVCQLARLLRPRLVLIENVPQFGHVHSGRLLGQVRVHLGQAGYTTDFRVLQAAQFGVPQVRTRGFLLALRADVRSSERPLHELLRTVGSTTSFVSRDEARHACDGYKPGVSVSVKEALDDLPVLRAGEGSEESCYLSTFTTPYQAFLRNSNALLFNHVAVRHSVPILNAMRELRPGETPQRLADHPLRRKEYFRAAYARLDPSLPAPTITTQTHNPGSGRFTHYRDDRVITVREAARLQSFPDHFRFFGTQEVQRRHVGNAVPPLLARAIADVLLPLLLERAASP